MIAFGGLEPMELNDERFCISMIVNEKYRGRGYGSEVVKYLIEFLQLNDLQANARCYVKNELSKKTLLKAGMRISNKLLKVENIK
jgi:RimJ/RimL family protein N-acetyltransferase